MHIGFPFGVDARGHTRQTPDAQYVRELIEQVLFTAPGERVMRPQFGSGARHLLFDPNSVELAATTEFAVRGALQRYVGDLVQLHDIDVSSEDATLHITVRYTVVGEAAPRTDQFSGQL